MLKKLLDRKVPMPDVVFATAFNQYAVRAFEVNAIDYLLKPFDRKRVMQTIEKAQARKVAPAGSGGLGLETGAKLDALLRLVEEQTQVPKANSGKVIVRAQSRLLLVDQREICFASIEDGTISVVTKAVEGHSNCRTLEELMDQLDPETFWRGAPVVCGEYPAHTGGRALVQVQLPAADGRLPEDGDSSKPGPDEEVEGAIQLVGVPPYYRRVSHLF